MRVLWAIVFSVVLAANALAQTVKVAAAISLRESLARVADQFKTETGVGVEFTFGSSGQLAAQIQGGAPIDLFISAANKQVEDLIKSDSVDAATRRVVAMNSLVLIVPKDAPNPPASLADLTSKAVRKIAIGEPRTVPAGQYAMQSLQHAGITELVKDKLIFGSNVRQVLDYVERGEVSAGLVYATDAKMSGEKIRLIGVIDPESHEPIVYPSVIVKQAPNKAAAERFIEFLLSPKAQGTLADFGFTSANGAK